MSDPTRDYPCIWCGSASNDCGDPRCCDECDHPYPTIRETLAALHKAEFEREEREHARTMRERDDAAAWADRLAAALGGAAIGEHSNLNNPWQNALDNPAALPPTPAPLVRERVIKALDSLDVIDGIVDDTHPEGDGCPLCHELDNLREVLDALRSTP